MGWAVSCKFNGVAGEKETLQEEKNHEWKLWKSEKRNKGCLLTWLGAREGQNQKDKDFVSLQTRRRRNGDGGFWRVSQTLCRRQGLPTTVYPQPAGRKWVSDKKIGTVGCYFVGSILGLEKKNTRVGHFLIILTVIRGGFGPEHI